MTEIFQMILLFFAVSVFSPGFCLKESQGPLCRKIGCLWELKEGKVTCVPRLEWKKSSVISLPSISSRQVQILAACLLKVFFFSLGKCICLMFASRRILKVMIVLSAWNFCRQAMSISKAEHSGKHNFLQWNSFLIFACYIVLFLIIFTTVSITF